MMMQMIRRRRKRGSNSQLPELRLGALECLRVGGLDASMLGRVNARTLGCFDVPSPFTT